MHWLKQELNYSQEQQEMQMSRWNLSWQENCHTTRIHAALIMTMNMAKAINAAIMDAEITAVTAEQKNKIRKNKKTKTEKLPVILDRVIY